MNATLTEAPVPLEAVLRNEDLYRRPARTPDFESENRALVGLVRAMADAPQTVLQALADTVLEVLRVGSAGVSLLTDDGRNFYWPAVAGGWRSWVGSETSRDFSPCGDVLDRGVPLLFDRFDRRYPKLAAAVPLAGEVLLVPFYVEGRAVGTIWAVAHDDRTFDAEDLRLLESLGRFASASHRIYDSLRAADAQRRVAEGLAEEEVRSRRATEALVEELRRGEERFRALFDRGPIAIYCCDIDGTVVEFNPRAVELWGREPTRGDTSERFCGSHRLFLPDGTPLPHDRTPVVEVLSGRLPSVFDAEVVMERPDGSRITIVANIVPLRDDRGEVTGAMNCFYDITDRKRDEDALRESEAFKRSIIESSPDCIKVLDLEGNLLSMLNGQELLGIEDISPYIDKSWIEFWQERDRPAARAAFEAAAAGDEANFVGFFRTLHGEDKWWDVAISPILDALGRPASLLAVSRDVTRRKESEDSLRESQSRMRHAADAAGLTYAEIDLTTGGSRTADNFAAVMGFAPPPEQRADVAVGVRSVLEHVVAEDRERVGAALGQFVGGTPVGRIEYRVLGDDGIERWIESVWSLEFGPDGGPTKSFATNLDISQRKRTEEQLRQLAAELSEADGRKNEFLAMLSHELRNPLAPISNAVHLLRLQNSPDPVQRQARSVIERQIVQLTRLVDDLMEVSRISTGRVHLRRERVVLSGIVERAAETVEPLVTRHRHELTVSLPTEPIWLDADAGRLEQVVVNLLTNAAKYTEDGGRIGLSVEAGPGECVVRVRDTGVGIAPALLPRVFDLFTQAERSLDRAQGGLGIGLALVRRLVEMHGGTVEAHSVVGRGSEFVVRLPTVSIPSAVAPTAPEAVAESDPARLRILVVDDNVDAAESLAMLLEVSGHDVRTAHDGPKGLEAVRDYRPDLVFMDIGLPGMDGYAVAEKLRHRPDRPGIVLVALTGYGQESDRERSRDAGFDHHLVKPADFGRVRQIVAGVLARSPGKGAG